MNISNSFRETERWLKRGLKRKVSITEGLLVAFMITGGLFGVSQNAEAGTVLAGTTGTATGANAVSLGTETEASERVSIAMGWRSKAAGAYSTAMGDRTKALGDTSTSMGDRSIASGMHSMATNYRTKAIGKDSFTINTRTKAKGERSFAAGYLSEAIGEGSFATGGAENGIDIYGKYINSKDYDGLKAKYSDVFTADVSAQLDAIMDEEEKLDFIEEKLVAAGKLKAGGKAYTAGSMALGTGTIAGVEGGEQAAVAIGYRAKATGNKSMALGFDSEAKADRTVAIGTGVKATGNKSMALGNSSFALGEASFAYGGRGDLPSDSNLMTLLKDKDYTTIKENYKDIFGADDITKLDEMSDKEKKNFIILRAAQNKYRISAVAYGMGSIALGNGTTAEGGDSVSIGVLNSSRGYASTALGGATQAIGNESLATNWGTRAIGNYSTAMGSRSLAVGEGSLATGGMLNHRVLELLSNSDATADYEAIVTEFKNAFTGEEIAFITDKDAPRGKKYELIVEKVGKFYSTLGGKAYSNGSIALGTGTVAGTAVIDEKGNDIFTDDTYTPGTEEAVAIGYRSKATGNKSIALGFDSEATGDGAVVLGTENNAQGHYSLAGGRNSYAFGKGAISMGYGEGDPELSKLLKEGNYEKIKEVYKAAFTPEDIIELDNRTDKKAKERFAIYKISKITNKFGSLAYGENSIALGNGALAEAKNSIAIGYKAKATGNQSTAVGDKTLATGENSLATGTLNIASGYASTAMGGKTVASGYETTAMGWKSKASGNFSTAMGVDSSAIGEGSLASGGYLKSSRVFELLNKHDYDTIKTEFSDVFTAEDLVKLESLPTETVDGTTETKYHFVVDKMLKAQNTSGGKAYTAGSMALGTGTIAGVEGGKQEAFAMGYRAKATGNKSMALGFDAEAETLNTIALGAEAKANRINGIAIGYKADAGKENIKAENTSLYNNIAIGANSIATGGQSVAIGSSGTGYETKGRQTVASGVQTIALGQDTHATGDSSIALGGDDLQKVSDTNFDGTVVENPDAYGGLGEIATYWKELTGNNIDWESKKDASGKWIEDKTSNRIATTASGAGSMALGVQSVAEGHLGMAIGLKSKAKGLSSIAIGQGAEAEAQESIALGTVAKSVGASSIAIGKKSLAEGEQSIAVGTGNTVSGAHSGAFGDPNVVSGEASYAVGNNNTIAQDNTFVLGSGVTTTQANAVVLGNDSADKAHAQVASKKVGDINYTGFAGTATGVVSVGKEGAERQVVNVAAGEISATSTDAVNGSQLFATNTAINSVANTVKDNFGGNAALAENGAITFTNIGGTGADTIDAAIANVKNLADDKSIEIVNAGDGIKVTGGTGEQDKNWTVALADNIKNKLDNLADNANATYLKTDGSNIGNNKLIFGEAVGTATLADTAELAQIKAVKAVDDKVNVNTTNITNLGDEITKVGKTSKEEVKVDPDSALTLDTTAATADKGAVYTLGINKNKLITDIVNNNNTITNIENAANLTYKATNKNGILTGQKEVSLADGLNFKETDDIKATVGDNGEVSFELGDNVALGKDGKDGHIGVAGKDGKNGVGIDGKDGISVKGKDGQDGVTIKGEDGANGTNGVIGLNGHDGINGQDGKDVSADIKVMNGTPGLNGTDGMTRIVYEDQDGTDHEVATLDDGLKFKGDNNVSLAKKLNEELEIIGGAPASDLVDGNIGVNSTADGKLKVQLAKNLTGISSIANGTTVVTLGDTEKVINVNDARITGLADGTSAKDAVNFGQLKAVEDKITTSVTGTSLKYKATNKAGVLIGEETVALADGLNFKETGDIKATVGDNGEVSFKLGDEVEIGKAGADGKDGHIGVDGKDGKSGVGIDGKDGITVKGDKGEIGINGNDGISIKGEDGKDGSIGLSGKDGISVKGKDGQDGVTIKGEDGANGTNGVIGINGHDGINGQDGKDVSADIKVMNGTPGLDGTDGMTRIVYEDQDGTDHEVATLDDGLKFKGDDATVLAKHLNEQLDIVGGATGDLTDGNIGVNSSNGSLRVQLAKDLTGISSIGNTTNGGKITLGETDNSVSVNGGRITNVADATSNTDAVNYKQLTDKLNSTIDAAQTGEIIFTGNTLDEVKISAGKTLTVEGQKGTDPAKNLTKDSEFAADNIFVDSTDGKLEIKLAKKLQNIDSIGLSGKDGISVKGKDGQDGVTIKGEDGANGTNGVIGINGHDGINGQDGKDVSADIKVMNGTPGLNGIDGMTRVVYEDQDGKVYEVATLDDGMKFMGDSGTAKAVKLNKQLDITGGITDANLLSAGNNVGVVARANGLRINLAKDLTGISSIANGTTVVTLGATEKVVNVNDAKITGLADGEVSSTSTDAITGKQLKEVADKITTSATGTAVKFEVVDESGLKLTENNNAYKLDLDAASLGDDSKTAWKKALGINSNGTTTVDLSNKADKNAANLEAQDVTAWKKKLGVDNILTQANLDDKLNKADLHNITSKEIVISNGGNLTKGDVNLSLRDGSIAKVKLHKDLIAEIDGKASITGDNIVDKKTFRENIEVFSKDEVNQKIDGIVSGDIKLDGKVAPKEEKGVKGKVIDKHLKDNYVSKKELGDVGGAITNVRKDVQANSKEIRRVGATSAALAGLHPMQYDPRQKTQVMAAIGAYRDSQAVAVGINHHFTENFMVTGGIATGGHRKNTAANLGFTWKLGSEESRKDLPKRYEKGPIGSIYIMQNEMNALLKENYKQKSKLREEQNLNTQQAQEIQNMNQKINYLLQKIQQMEGKGKRR